METLVMETAEQYLQETREEDAGLVCFLSPTRVSTALGSCREDVTQS